MKVIDYYLESWRRFRDLQGRTTRPAFWWPFLINPIVFLVLGGIFAAILGLSTDQTGPEVVYGIAYVWVLITLGVRRLHDMGRSGWWLLIALTGIGVILLIVWACRSGENEANAWGSPSDSTRSDKGKPQSRPPDYGAPAPDSPIS
jgi:uncharacterized membrane protein YhaH (DUF805 family)